jgi:hypothetical protein
MERADMLSLRAVAGGRMTDHKCNKDITDGLGITERSNNTIRKTFIRSD